MAIIGCCFDMAALTAVSYTHLDVYKRQLQEQWWLTGALPAAAAAELDSRFLHAARVWWRREEEV